MTIVPAIEFNSRQADAIKSQLIRDFPNSFNEIEPLGIYEKLGVDVEHEIAALSEQGQRQLAKVDNRRALDVLVKSPCAIVRSFVAQHKHLAHLDELYKDSSSLVRKACAESSITHAMMLKGDESTVVRIAVANWNCVAANICLSKDKDYKVRAAVAQHYQVSILMDMVGDSSPTVRAEVAKHANESITRALAHDGSKAVQREVAKHNHKASIEILLSTTKDSSVLVEIAKHPVDEWLDKLCSHSSRFVRLEVAKHGKAHHAEKLISDVCPRVRGEVALNADISFTRALLSDPNGEVKKGLAQRGELEVLLQLIEGANPDCNLDQNLLIEVAKHNYPEVFSALVGSELSGVRAHLAKHDVESQLIELALDDCHFVRQEVAKHSYKSIYEILMNDSCDSVREKLYEQPEFHAFLATVDPSRILTPR